jgi:hypothetical protein
MENLREFTIQGEDVDFITCTPTIREYKPTTINDAGEEVPNEVSPLFGKKYKVFSYNGKGFAVNVEDEFCKLYDADQLWKVRFTENESGQLSLVKGISITRAKNTANTKRVLTAIENAPLTIESVSEDLMADITNSSIG